MNQAEMSVLMKKYYDARWVSQKNAFRFEKNKRCFEITVKYGQSPNAIKVWVDRIYLSERIIPNDENGKIKDRVIAELDKPPENSIDVRKWINKQLIGAFLEEFCVVPEPTTATPLSAAEL